LRGQGGIFQGMGLMRMPGETIRCRVPELRGWVSVRGSLGWGLVWLLVGCGYPLGLCSAERIEVAMAAFIERKEGQRSESLFGTLAPGNLAPAEYRAVRRVLIEDAARAREAVVLTLPAFASDLGWIALAVQAPLRPGDRFPIAGAFNGAGWGTVTLPRGVAAQIAVREERFVATEATGMIEVLRIDPLELLIDVRVTGGGGNGMHIEGTLDFRLVRETVPCT
jgi:hypothetical protein